MNEGREVEKTDGNKNKRRTKKGLKEYEDRKKKG